MNQSATRKFIRQAISMTVLILMIGVIWELIKVVGGDPWWADSNPFGWEFKPPFRWKFASDLNLPHLWDIFGSFAQPAAQHEPFGQRDDQEKENTDDRTDQNRGPQFARP